MHYRIAGGRGRVSIMFRGVLRTPRSPTVFSFTVYHDHTDDNKQQWRIEERDDWKALLESMQTDRTVLQQQTARLKVQEIVTRLEHLVQSGGCIALPHYDCAGFPLEVGEGIPRIGLHGIHCATVCLYLVCLFVQGGDCLLIDE